MLKLSDRQVFESMNWHQVFYRVEPDSGRVYEDSFLSLGPVDADFEFFGYDEEDQCTIIFLRCEKVPYQKGFTSNTK